MIRKSSMHLLRPSGLRARQTYCGSRGTQTGDVRQFLGHIWRCQRCMKAALEKPCEEHAAALGVRVAETP